MLDSPWSTTASKCHPRLTEEQEWLRTLQLLSTCKTILRRQVFKIDTQGLWAITEHVTPYWKWVLKCSSLLSLLLNFFFFCEIIWSKSSIYVLVYWLFCCWFCWVVVFANKSFFFVCEIWNEHRKGRVSMIKSSTSKLEWNSVLKWQIMDAILALFRLAMF